MVGNPDSWPERVSGKLKMRRPASIGRITRYRKSENWGHLEGWNYYIFTTVGVPELSKSSTQSREII